LTPLWIFPSTCSIPIQSSVQPEHSKTPSLPQDVFGNCGTLSQLFRAFAASHEIPDPDFLDCGGLTPLWIFPSTRSIPTQSSVKPEHSKTPSFPQNVFGNCTTWARELTENLLLPFISRLRGFASSRETLPPACVRRSADVCRLHPRYVRRGIPTEIHFRFHPPG
jgi:hypothetical protein